MEWVETTGKTIEEAKDSALDQLGVDESDAEFEVLEEPRTGLFGRVRGEARIRARIEPTRPRPKVERRDRRKREGGGRNKKSGTGAESAAAGTPAAESKPGGRRPAGGSGGGGRSKSAKNPPTESLSASEPGADAESDRSPGGGRNTRSRKSTTGTAARKKSESPSRTAVGGTEMTDQDVNVEEQAELMATFLGGLVEAFGLEGSVEQTRLDDDTMEVQVVGDDLGLLIGPKGQTLMAVQELSRTYVQRKATGTHHGRVRIDVGGYRARRRDALERFTTQVAEQVLASGAQKALEPMNASDRKVVHDTANGIDGVRTMSEGEEPRRRVVIAPD